MAVQQTAIFTVYIVEHRPPPCAVTIHKTRTDQQWNGFQDSACIQDQRSMCWQHTKRFEPSCSDGYAVWHNLDYRLSAHVVIFAMTQARCTCMNGCVSEIILCRLGKLENEEREAICRGAD